MVMNPKRPLPKPLNRIPRKAKSSRSSPSAGISSSVPSPVSLHRTPYQSRPSEDPLSVITVEEIIEPLRLGSLLLGGSLLGCGLLLGSSGLGGGR